MKAHLQPVIFALLLLVWIAGGAAAADNALKYKLKPGTQDKLCSGCHPDFEGKLKSTHVHTPVKKGECTGCHNPHTSTHGKLLASDRTKICATCHSTVFGPSDKSIHRVVQEGGCVKCHDPHGSPNPGNLLKEGNELCFSCHKEMGETVAKVRFKHPPVAKGCLTCHAPHSSPQNGFLLKSSVPALCIGCHKTDKPIFVKQHLNFPMEKANCTSCHDPHGSDVQGILFNTVHRPVAAKQCIQCHEGAASATPLRLKKGGYELCRGCHSDMVNDAFAKNRVHWPLLSKKGCLTCHTPHAAPKKGLLAANMLTLCGSCHADTIRRQQQSETKHKPIAEGNCTACHNPHATETLYLLKQGSVIELCGTCHDWQKHSTHPIGDKYKDPRGKNTTMNCLSCHRSHGTEYKHFIPFVTVSELCTQCHEKYKR